MPCDHSTVRTKFLYEMNDKKQVEIAGRKMEFSYNKMKQDREGRRSENETI